MRTSGRIKELYTVSLFFPGIAAVALQQQGQASPGLSPLFMIGGLVMIMYLLLFRPQQQQRKRWQEMVNSIKNGDKVTTSGGIRGQVISIKDDVVQLRLPPDNVKIEVVKSAIMALDTPNSDKDKEKEKEKDKKEK